MIKSDQAPLRHPALAAKIVEGRAGRGFTQAAFAAELGFKQQAVSRWEAGTHRPTVAQIPALAALIDDDVATLMQLAGYGSPVSASLSTLFPVDALDPATFEQFVCDVVQALHPSADASVQGSRGHKQEGTDIVARFPNGRKWSFQCKRVERFGKAEIDKAIAYHSVEAERSFLVLSKIASPASAEAVDAHQGWTLWDKQDLTRKIRSLSIETQERLVDIYFRGQRMALLGRSEPGPWLTPEEYFAPFKGRGAVFSHDWSLVGREREIAELVESLGRNDMPFSLLIGSGGIGKTRILKEGIQHFAAKNTGTAIRFLSASQDPDAASLEALGTGRRVLVVDDAHDREGLKLLIEYAVDPRHKTRLLIATRPYAEQRIRNELALYRIADPSAMRLERLEKQALHALVVEVLEEFGGDPEWAGAILAIAADSPLVAAMAARVVARDGITPELARGERELRRIILSRFTRVITGHLGAATDAALLRAVLELLAIIQPFHIDDRRIGELVEATRPGIVVADVSRALKMLVDGGVIYKRGQLYRLMPDLLGDFLIEESCIGADERLTPFALAVADAVDGNRLTQVLVNLGRIDWRRMEGDPSESDLLEPIWHKLRAIEDRYDSRIEAVQAVAYYQPRQALEFVQAQIEQDRVLNEFSAILRRVAFSLEHRRDALRLLWELGQNDNRDLNPHPSHPIRTLAELIGYDCNKPFAFVAEVAEFGFALLDEPSAWGGRYTPFDVLAPLLNGEGVTTTSTGRAISMSPFFVDYKVVAHLRTRLIERIITLLDAEDLRIAHRAAHFLSNAVRPPHGMLNSVLPDELLRQYEVEFSQTIGKVGALIASGTLAPTTMIGLVRSLHWFAQFDKGELGDQVRRIFAALPHDLDFRFHAALAEGAEYSFVGQVHYAYWEDDSEWLGGFVAELLAAYPDRRTLCAAFLTHRETVEAAGMSTFPGQHLADKLIVADLAIGREIIERSLAEPDTRLRDYVGIAVGAVIETRPDEGRALVARMLASPEPIIRSGGARGLIGLRRERCTADVGLLREALSAEDSVVASIAVTALRNWSDLDDRETIALALAVAFGRATDLFEAVSELLCIRRSVLLDHLREEDARCLLDRMMALPRLDGHWAGELLTGLAKHHGVLVAQFLLARADLGLSDEAPEDFRAIGYSNRRRHLALQESPAVGDILERAWLWLRRHDGAAAWARYQIGELFAAMFKLDSTPVVEFLDTMLDRVMAGDLRWIGYILRNSHHRFVFKHRGFVERYLNRCKAVEAKLVKDAIDQLGAAAMSGSWSGSPGEPMPRDIQARDEATAVLATLSRLSPAYPLYNAILQHSKQNIARSIADGEALDADE
jgi:transcriptional regulator with XRE-family HTH domain